MDDINVLLVDGKRFENVRGLRTFYLTVPSIDAIVFATTGTNYSCVYHVYGMSNREDIAIQVSGSVFGLAIGSTNAARTDTVHVEARTVILCTHFTEPDREVKVCDYLSLDNKAIVARKTLVYDKEGRITLEKDSSPPF